MYPSLPVLVVDDEEAALRAVSRTLRSGGIDNVVCLQDSRRVAEALAGRDVGAMMLDLVMPHVSGEEVLGMMLEQYPHVPVIVCTALDEVDTAVRCMRLGAFDYMVKPVEKSRAVSGIKRAIEISELRRENIELRERMLSDELQHPEAFSEIITRSPAMLSVFRYVETVSTTDKPVLVTGETGTGKELIARAVHVLSGRSGRFVPVNVAGLDDNVFSDTLFGHLRGAFTGAEQARPGLIERAAGGTLFLDEIGDLSPASQVKLLRLLQEGEYLALGADLPKSTDARMILATNRDLQAAQAEGHFRNDLYFRLQTHHIHIPPLRERKDDLPALGEHLIAKAAEALNQTAPEAPPELYEFLAEHTFPGNVREMEALFFDAVSRQEGETLSLEPFRHLVREKAIEPASAPEPPGCGDITFPESLPTVEQATNQLVAEAMRRAEGNQSLASRLLGVSRTTLAKRLKRLDKWGP